MNKENESYGAQKSSNKRSRNFSVAVTDGSERDIDPNSSHDDDNGFNSDKLCQVENTEDVIKFSHLLFEGKYFLYSPVS